MSVTGDGWVLGLPRDPRLRYSVSPIIPAQPPLSGRPRPAVTSWREIPQILATTEQRAHPVKRPRCGAQGAGLHQRVAQGGGLSRPGHDRQSERVRRELAQQRVPRAAADDVDHVGVLPGQ